MDTLRCYFVTWNVATRSPEQDLNSLLDYPSQFNKNKPLYDFYIIGLQEVKSQPQNLILDAFFSDPWTAAFNKILCHHSFILAKTMRLQGILLMVYTQIKHLTHLRDVEAQFTKTGLHGFWGNKGAVSVRFNIYGCSVCFVNSHLAAHDHLLDERISDYNTILKNHLYHVYETVNILYHDYVFWIGDLNFRVGSPSGGGPSATDIVTSLGKIEKDNYTTLLKHDQLNTVMERGEAFSEFTEPAIKFPPTYKFMIGGDDYDVKRKPSWTDRIMYKVMPNNYENITLKAEVVSYNHAPQYKISDHKPVYAQINIKIPRPPCLVSPRSARSASMLSYRVASVVTDGRYKAEDQVDSGNNEVFSNFSEQGVVFDRWAAPYYIGDAELRARCSLAADVTVRENDWIGIYDANFQNLDDYIAYEYLSKVSLPPPAPSAGPGPGPGAGSSRNITLSFPVGSGVRTPGFYRLIYFSQPNNDVRSVLGISEPFEVSSREDRNISIDPCDRATGSRPTDIFTDFTGLDVANLTRHFNHDLSID